MIVTALALVVVRAAPGPGSGPKIRLSIGPGQGALTATAAEGQSVYQVFQDASFSFSGSVRVAFRSSEDGGRNYGPYHFLGGGAHPSIAAVRDEVYVAWRQNSTRESSGGGNNEIWVTSSADRGQSFGAPARLDADDFDSLDPLVAATEAGTWVAWGDLHGDIYVSRFLPAQNSWARVKVGSDHVWQSSPSIGAAGGNVAVVWKKYLSTTRESEVLAAVSTDSGETFAQPVMVSKPGSPPHEIRFPRVALQDANVIVTWEQSAMPLDPPVAMVATSIDAGATFASPLVLGRKSGLSLGPSIVARRGLVAVAWNSGNGVLVASSSDGGQSFSGAVQVAWGDSESLPELALARDQDGPRAVFDWSVPARFGLDDNHDGLIDYRTDSAAVQKPATLATTLDGCNSVPDGSSFMLHDWVVDGAVVAGHECKIVRDLAPGTAHRISLKVTQNGFSNVVSHDVTVDDRLVVSIGDSVGSGEGNPDLPGASTWPWSPDARWQDLQCNRSALAGPAVAAKLLEDGDPHYSVTFVHLACSGASITGSDVAHGGLLTPYEGINPGAGALLPSQLDQLRTLAGQRPVDALLVSIGANDVHFSEVVKACLLSSGCTEGETLADFDWRMAMLPDHFRDLSAALQGLVSPERVYLTQYFDPTVTETGAWDLSCVARPVGISDTAARWASDYVGAKLNSALAAACATYGWNVVGGMAEGFRGHGYCAADSWVVQLGEAFAEQDSKNGAFHPNNKGHEYYGRALNAAVAGGWQALEPAAPADGSTLDELGDVYLAWENRRQMMVTTLVQGGGGLHPTGTRNVSNTVRYGMAFRASPAATDRGAWVGWTEHLDTDDASTNAYQAFTGVAAAGPPNLALSSVGLVQSPSKPLALVAGKSTAVEAIVDSSFFEDKWALAHYRVTDAAGSAVLDENTVVSLHPGKNRIFLHPSSTLLLPVDGASLKASVEIDPDNQIAERVESDNAALSGAVPVRHTRKLKVLYVPVAGGSCVSALEMARLSTGFAEGVLPLANGDLLQKSDCALALAVAESGPLAALKTLGQLDSLARLLGYDQAVGVTPMGWLVSNWAPATIGLAIDPSAGAAPSAGVLVEQGAVPAVVVHELSHTFGQAHVAGAVANGYWLTNRAAQTGRELMNPTLVNDPWLSVPVFEYLRARLAATPGDPPVLLIRGSIAADGAVTAGNWFQQMGLLDAALGETGTVTLEYRNSSGAVLGSVGFDPAGADVIRAIVGPPAAEVPAAGVRLFSLRVPDLLAGTRSLVLREGNNVLFTRPVSVHAPTVAFTAPAGGDTITSGTAVTATVLAVDADSDTLAHTYAISSDGGATWRPLAMDVAGSSFTFTTTPDLAGTDVRLRVFTSDGVNTASADSPSFVIVRGAIPEQRIAYLRDKEYQSPYLYPELWTMRLDGTDQQLVQLPGAHYGQPDWSPDGSMLAFDTDLWGNYVTTRALAIAVAARDGSGFRQLTVDPTPSPNILTHWSFDCPDWSPDGSRVSFVANQTVNQLGGASQLMTIAADGTDPRVVLDMAAADLDPFFGAVIPITRPRSCPRWSPNGTQLAFMAKRQYHDVPDPTAYMNAVYVIGADGSGLTRLWGGAEVSSLVDWSPDGTRLLFSTYALEGSNYVPQIWSMASDGSDARYLAPFLNGNYMRLSPDGSRLYQSRESEIPGNTYDFVTTDLSGGDVVTVVADPTWDYLTPDWGSFAPSTIDPPDPEPRKPADAGGPYRAIENVPLELSAGNSLLADSELPLAEWDLDSDGAFDDATGLHPVVTFTAAGSVSIAVRITTFGGTSAVSEAETVTVTPAPPAVVPSPHITVRVAMPASFDLALVGGSGADAYTVTVDWGDGTRDQGSVSAGRASAAHAYQATGDFVITMWICTATGVCSEARVDVTVAASVAANNPPVANDVAINIDRATRVTVPLQGSDPDGNPLEYHLADAPVHGESVQLPDGSVTYLPDTDFAGIDSFTFIADDGLATSAPATVLVTVGNLAPVAGNDTVQVAADVTTEIPADQLLGNDSDPEGSPVALAGVYAEAGSQVAVERSPSGVRVTPDAGFVGTTTFSYGVTDGQGGFSLATVNVVVTGTPGPIEGADGKDASTGGCSCATGPGPQSRPGAALLAFIALVAIYLRTARTRK